MGTSWDPCDNKLTPLSLFATSALVLCLRTRQEPTQVEQIVLLHSPLKFYTTDSRPDPQPVTKQLLLRWLKLVPIFKRPDHRKGTELDQGPML